MSADKPKPSSTFASLIWIGAVAVIAAATLALAMLLPSYLAASRAQAEINESRIGAGDFLLSVGYDRWVAACAYALSKDGLSVEETTIRCTIDHSNSGASHEAIVEKRLLDARLNSKS